MCYLLRELKTEGKKIFQVEPFLEILLGIHEFFADGHHPGELQKDSVQYPVYLAERDVTRALLAYYQTAMNGSFEKTLEAVKQFARLDAARFRLRDSLRAQALAPLVKKYPSAYIEAGVIHYPLWRLLRRQLPPPNRLRVIFLANAALKTLGRKGHMYGPGEQLTLLYIFHSNFRQPRREAVLAARGDDPYRAREAVGQLREWVEREDWSVILDNYARCVRITRDFEEEFSLDPDR